MGRSVHPLGNEVPWGGGASGTLTPSKPVSVDNMMTRQHIRWMGVLSVVLALGWANSAPAQANFTQSRATQVQLTVDGAAGSASSNNTQGFAISGSGISVHGPLNDGIHLNPNAQFQAPTDGSGFTFSMSTFTPNTSEAMVLAPGESVTLPAYSDLSVTVGGVTGDLGGQITSLGEATISPGGPGTRAVLTQTRSFSVFGGSTSSP